MKELNLWTWSEDVYSGLMRRMPARLITSDIGWTLVDAWRPALVTVSWFRKRSRPSMEPSDAVTYSLKC